MLGEVECIAMRTCEPCLRLAELTGQPGVVRGLAHRGGLRAAIITDGEIAVGDEIYTL